ncbi:hypothetical protein RYX36_006670 [Vicia faba]
MATQTIKRNPLFVKADELKPGTSGRTLAMKVVSSSSVKTVSSRGGRSSVIASRSREWSAYGAGVPLILNDKDSVVQYYVPYLSGIQIYAHTVKPPVKSRQLCNDSDSDFRDSSSDGSSDCEPARGYREQRNLPHLSDDLSNWMGRLSVRNQHTLLQDGFSSDDGESINSQGYLLSEYFERDTPYGREPLADKMMDLAFRFPQLLTLRSCDILSSSWISVAWYSSLIMYFDILLMHMPMGLTWFYVWFFKGPLWTPSGGYERQLSNSLLQNADKWLRLLQPLIA